MSRTGARPDFWCNMIGSGDPRAGSFNYWDGSDPSCECDEVTPDALDSPEDLSPQIPPLRSQTEVEGSAPDILHPDVPVSETLHRSCLSNASDRPLKQDNHSPCPRPLALYPACDSLSRREDTFLPVDSELCCSEHSEFSHEQALNSGSPESANDRSEFPLPGTRARLIFSASSLPPTPLYSSAQAGLLVTVCISSCFDSTPLSPPPTHAPPPSRHPHAAELQCAYPHLSQVVEDIAQVRARMARTLRAVECALSLSSFPALSSLRPSHHGPGSGCSSGSSSRSCARASSPSACTTARRSSALVDDDPRSPPRCSRDVGSACGGEDSQPSSAVFTPSSSSWTFKMELDSEVGGGRAKALIMSIGQQLALRVHSTLTSTRHRARVSTNPLACTPVCAGSRTQMHQRSERYRSRSRYPDRRSPRAGER